MYNYPDRYAKADPRNIRENPKDDLDEALAEDEAAREVDLFLDRYRNSPNFRRRVALKIAQREVLANKTNETRNNVANVDNGI
jgi:hypothetical protein